MRHVYVVRPDPKTGRLTRTAYFREVSEPRAVDRGGRRERLRGFYEGKYHTVEQDGSAGFDLRLEHANTLLRDTGGYTFRLTHIDGYYSDEHGLDTMQPIVARLPRGRGFLPGWSMGAGMAATLDCGHVYVNAVDAGIAAHTLTERAAEEQQDYERRMRIEDAAAEEAADRQAELAELGPVGA